MAVADPEPYAFENLGLRAGIWHGRLAGGGGTAPARLLLVLEGRVLAERVPQEGDGAGPDGWPVAMPVPPEALGQGLALLALLADPGPSGAPPMPQAQRLATLTLSAGAPLAGDDVQAELALLRAEIELLKRVMRQMLQTDD